ncbi:TonB-dependent siderophore receptor [Ancylobacter sp. 6x-1]|uniref:TonB-dependent siderophore receptor n=1 Tax=Ancylobacter crimeensis TaxID=2579147 RepID=A0ABT0D9Z2_9HYPH|nr:TonB-dependent siderophore receptor [Ancylobacter crimeensis]MCK0196752.1 TonB-dependent siderophore receptor [Ancylobacter crimeensis]
MKTLRSLRTTNPNAALTAGLAVTLSAIPFADALAQQATTATTSGTEELPVVTVEGEGAAANTLEASTGISRLPGTVQDTPQVVQVISQQQMQEQGITTLDQALRNVPGVTVSIGEGGGGMNGDQFRIRGFQAKGDIFVNGLRDFGVYTRDSFAYENVQVLKGPSSEGFGLGTTGGVINSTLKQAHLGDKYDFEGQIGTGMLYRGVVDLNKQIDATTAFRIVAMFNEQDIADRDHVSNDRYGVMASLAFGLGTDQTLTFNYLYQHGDRTPDYGVPIVTPGFNDVATFGKLGRPVTEFGVPRSTFYGKTTDKDITDANMFTANYKREVNDWLTITNDSRVGYYTREFATTVPGCGTGTTLAAYNASCTGQFFDGLDPAITFGGGNPGFDQETWSGQNVTTAIAKFNTGFLRHELVAGLDMYTVSSDRTLISVSGSKGTSTIWNPVFGNTTGYSLYSNPLASNGVRKSDATDLGLFVSDRMWITEQISFMAGTRYDTYSSDYTYWNGSTWAHADANTDFWSPKFAAIWEPTKEQTYYVSYAKSFTPQGSFPANDVTVVNSAQPNLDPEDNDTWEVGAKISLFEGRLGLTGTLFRVEKSNVFYTDPNTGDAVSAGEAQRVQGVELGVTGMITDAWSVQAGYAYYDSEVTSGTSTGKEVAFVSPNNFTLWTTYDLTKNVIRSLPGKLLVGAGVTYADEYYTNSANTAIIPETFSLDALVSYSWDKYRVALNAYNLTDELNYAQGFGNRAVPGSGRTFTLSMGVTF